jgi:hypothetical protein
MPRKIIVPKTDIQPEEFTKQNNEPSDKFEVNYDSDKQQVKFKLLNGTEVEISSPKAKQFLLLESFIKSASEEYKTDSFIMLKLVSLCITKFGNKTSITFNELLDLLEVEDIERLVAGLTFFRDKFDYIAKRGSSV